MLAFSSLGYSTTAFYFYHSRLQGEGAHRAHTTYSDTLLAVADDKPRLPYKYFLIDSFWYGEDCNRGEGVLRWEDSAAMERDCLLNVTRFPGGLANLSSLLGDRGQFVLHLGMWLADTPYASNKSFEFVAHPNSTNPRWGAALTRSPVFWSWLIKQAKAAGLAVLKQDHVDNQIANTPECWQQLNFTQDWMEALGGALADNGLTLQAGGYTVRGLLHSTKLKAATHARVAPDYMGWRDGNNDTIAGRSGLYFSYGVGPASLLAWAVGLLPYKDSFYSSSTEVNTDPSGESKYQNFTEPFPYTHALASALSAGPISPGDGVGGGDAALVMTLCRSDGTLLKPERPAISMDAYWIRKQFGGGVAAAGSKRGPEEVTQPLSASMVDGQLWSTHVELPLTSADGLNNNQVALWHLLTAIQLEEAYNLSLAELRSATAAWGGPTPHSNQAPVAALWTESGVPTAFVLLNDSSALPLAKGNPKLGYGSLQYYVVAEPLSNGWVVWGEAGKIIPVSRQRVVSLELNSSSVLVHLHGTEGERGVFLFQYWGGTSVTSMWRGGEAPGLLHCPFKFGSSGTTSVGTSLGGCSRR
jgi:hypothetical protein